MKLLTLVSTLLAVAYATPAELEAQEIQADSPKDLTKAENGVKILPRLSTAPPKDGATRTPVPYGTFVIQSSRMTKSNKMGKGPCLATCLVTAMEATIRYGASPSAPEANVDTGAWLHHIALFGAGGGSGSLWAAGNERPTLRLNNQYKYGLELSTFMMIIDLMSEDTKPKNVTLYITYDHVPKGASGYKSASMYWLTIGEPAAKNGVYKFSTVPQVSGINGKLLYAIGHMHDGGTDMRLFVNSKLVCKSVMHYNARAGYGKGDGGSAKAGKAAKAGGDMAGMSHGHSRRDGGPHGGHDGMEHISDPGACTDFGSVAKGDRLSAEAWYDANQHPLMIHNGKKENLMGNMRVYIGPS